MPSHYLTQCWFIVNLTLKNKSQWNLIHDEYIFFEEILLNIPSAKHRPCCPGVDALTGAGRSFDNYTMSRFDKRTTLIQFVFEGDICNLSLIYNVWGYEDWRSLLPLLFRVPIHFIEVIVSDLFLWLPIINIENGELSLVAPAFVAMTTSSVTTDHKVCIMIALGFN